MPPLPKGRGFFAQLPWRGIQFFSRIKGGNFMRTITKTAYNRYQAQINEAKILKMNELVETLEKKVSEQKVREDDQFYVYSAEQLEQDVKTALWDVAIRVQDYYNKVGDINSIQMLIADHAEEIIDGIRKIARAKTGYYEVPVPGEETVIEVSEND